MAKINIIHTCGHSETHNLFGPGKERDHKIEWLKSTLCTDCYKAEQQAKREAENAAAAAANTEAGLPALIGTEKQIAWAETIRAKAITQIEEILTATDANRANLSADQASELDRLHGDFRAIRQQASAAWWIDRRDYYGKQYLREAYDARQEAK